MCRDIDSSHAVLSLLCEKGDEFIIRVAASDFAFALLSNSGRIFAFASRQWAQINPSAFHGTMKLMPCLLSKALSHFSTKQVLFFLFFHACN
jgi:hypothetical protein